MWEQWLKEAERNAYRSVLWEGKQRYDQELYDQAEDAAQQGVLAAVKKGEPNFNDMYALINFVNTSAKNSALNVWKSAYERKRANLYGTDDGTDGSLPADELVIQEELPALIQQGFDKIGEPCREILNLYYFNGLTDIQIAMKQLGDQAIDANRQIINRQRRNCLDEFRWLLFEDGFDPKDWL